MNDSHSAGPQEATGSSSGGSLSLEQTLGSIVIQMLREGKYITHQNICIAVAARITMNIRPELEAHYADVLRLLLTREGG